MEPFNHHGTVPGKLQALANLSEERYKDFRLKGDLSLCEKNWAENIPLLGAKFSKVAPQFDQVAEFFKALETLQQEIMRNDYALLKDKEARPHLPRTIYTLLKISRIWDICPDILKVNEKIDAIGRVILKNLPHVGTHAYPRLDKMYFMDFYEYDWCASENLKKDLRKIFESTLQEVNALSTLSTDHSCITLIKRLLVIIHELPSDERGDKGQEIIDILHRMTMMFLEQPVLTADQVAFLEMIYKTPFTVAYTMEGNRGDAFKNHIGSKLSTCVESFDNHRDILSTFYRFFCLAQRFNKFMNTRKISTFDLPAREEENPLSLRYSEDPFNVQKQDLFELLLPHLPNLIEDESTRQQLIELAAYQGHYKTESSLMDVLLYLCITDSSDLRLCSSPKQLKMDVLFRAGLLIPDGEYLILSPKWERVIETFSLNPTSFLNVVFRNCEKIYEKNFRHAYYMRFLKGSSPLCYADYVVQKAFSENNQEISYLLINNMARMSQSDSRKVVFKDIPIEHYSRYIQLLEASEKTSNRHFIEVCYIELGHVFFDLLAKPKPLFKFVVPERILLELINRLNVVELRKVPKDFIVMDVTHFPSLTCRSLNALVNRVPGLNVRGFDYDHPSVLSDFTLEHETNIIYLNATLLKRGSEYFRGFLAPHFKEGLVENPSIELSREEFLFFHKWIDAFHHPQDKFSIGEMKNHAEMSKRLENTLEQYISDLTMAKDYHMDTLFELLDTIYTSLITSTFITSPEILQKIEKFRSLFDPTGENFWLNEELVILCQNIEQLKTSKFYHALKVNPFPILNKIRGNR